MIYEKNIKIICLSLSIALFPLLNTAFGQTHDDTKETLLEQALIQQLFPVIYSSLQTLYNEKYPVFDNEHIVKINSYITGTTSLDKPDKRVSATGGARVFEMVI